MIIKASDANKYANDGKAYALFMAAMEHIDMAIEDGHMMIEVEYEGEDESNVPKAVEWLIEQGYGATITDNGTIYVSWSNA